MTVRTAFLTYFALIALLALTVGPSFLPLGLANPVINFGIALAKSALVAVVFMHLGRSGSLLRLLLLVTAGGVLVLFAMTLLDALTR